MKNIYQNKDWLKSTEIIKLYGISRTTLYRWRKAGILNAVGRIGKKELLYSKKEIEELLASML